MVLSCQFAPPSMENTAPGMAATVMLLVPILLAMGEAGAFCSTLVMVRVDVTGSSAAVPACMVKLTVTG